MHVEAMEMRLTGELDAVPRARRFVRDALRDAGSSDLADDAAIVATELVTNALLHVGGPVLVRVRPLDEGVRLEVEDPGRAVPLRGLAGAESMTGRGLALVEAFARRWGADPLPDGKVVWCELTGGTAPTSFAADVFAASLLGDLGEAATEQAPRYEIALGDVPTDLLLSAKAHVDNLVREFVLMASGAESGAGQPVPPELAELIETVVHRFAEARRAIKRQAVAAALRGDERTSLVLTLGADSADAGEAYLDALDQADAYARAGHLLTLETPPQHRVFRRWYVESLVTQLRAAAAGEPSPRTLTLEQRLLEEIGVVAAAQRSAERASRLQALTAALAGATSDEEVAEIVVGQGVTALGASGGALLMPAADGSGRLTVLSSVGYSSDLVALLRAERQDETLPAASVLRTGEPVWLTSRGDRDLRFPGLHALEPMTTSLCAVPLVVAGRVLGALRLSFDEPQMFGDDERQFVVALAAQTAQALERSALYRAERQARANAESVASRLERLQRVMGELTGAEDVDHVSRLIVTEIGDALGSAVTSLSVVEGDVMRIIGMRGRADGVPERWRTFPVNGDLPASDALRTGDLVVVRGDSALVQRYPALRDRAGGDERILVALPLMVGNSRLGVITLRFPRDHDVDDPGERRFLSVLTDTCAQALARAQALSEARDAWEKLAFLAEASALLAASRGYRETLANVARLIVPRLADWCSVTVLDDGRFETVAIAHVDRARVAWAEELGRRYPVDPDARTGLPQVIRSGESEIYPEITDEMLVASAVDEEHLRLARELQLSSGIVVPLTARTGTFGAVSLFYAESGRHYNQADLSLVEDLCRRAAVAVENARAFETQSARLASISRVAEAAQHAILAPVPTRIGPVQLAAAYVSASRDALIGGDLYEVVTRPGAVRLLIGDVRGKGLDAVRLATVVLGLFRSGAVDHPDLVQVARQMDERLRPYLDEEDFVTALLVDVHEDGRCSLVCCGHPPPLLARDGVHQSLDCPPTVPLGLGVEPEETTIWLRPHDRLMLYTDGLVETRDPAGRFLELDEVAEPLAHGDVGGVLGSILARVQDAAGQRLSDDLALLVVEYGAG